MNRLSAQRGHSFDSGSEANEKIFSTASPKSVATALANHPFMEGMDEHQRRLLADCAMLCHFDPGDFILREGDPANRFYLIIRGKAALQTLTEEGKKVTFDTLGAGEVLGWSWLFPPYYWQFDAQAQEPTEAVFFYGTPLREECENDPHFGYELMKRISEVIIHRLQMTRKRLLRVITTPAEESAPPPS